MKILDRLARLLEVKSLVTLALTAAMVAMLFWGEEIAKEQMSLFSMAYGAVVTYFFTRKSSDAGDNKTDQD